MRLDEGAERLRMEVALPLQDLEALALEDVDLGRLALAGDADVAEDAPALEPAQQFRGVVKGEASKEKPAVRANCRMVRKR